MFLCWCSPQQFSVCSDQLLPASQSSGNYLLCLSTSDWHFSWHHMFFSWTYANFEEESVLCDIESLKPKTFWCRQYLWLFGAAVQKHLKGPPPLQPTASLKTGCGFLTSLCLLKWVGGLKASFHKLNVICIFVSL